MDTSTLAHTFINVAGVSFADGYPDNLHAIREIADQNPDGEGMTVLLLPEPDNAFDPQAIAVHVPGFGRIGYVPRTMCSWVHQILEQMSCTASVAGVRINPDHADKPGIDVRITARPKGQP